MATFKKTTSMPSSSAAPKDASGGSRMLRALFFLLALATVCAASIGATWLVMTRMQAQAASSAAHDNAIASDAQSAKDEGSDSLLASHDTVAEPPPPPPAPIFFELAPFTVTVDNDVTERVLHLGLTLRLADELSRQRLESYLPEARSRVLFELSKLNPEDLKGSESRVALATAIAGTLSRPFAPQPVGQYVTDVLFTTFVVQ